MTAIVARLPPGASTRERIRAAAVSLFAAKGFHAAGIREIADASGISTSSLYNYMGGKEELLAEIMIANIESAALAADLALARASTPAQQLAALVRSHVLVELEAPLEASVSDIELRALGPGTRTRVLRERDAYEDVWRQRIAHGVRKGCFSISNPSITRAVLIEACNGVVRWHCPDGRLPPTSVADQFVEIALRMVCAEEGGRRVELADVGEPSAADVAIIVRDVFATRLSADQS
jgi:AcrR family transcriptional regulator